MIPSTQITLREGKLVLVLPDRQGQLHEVALPDGSAEEVLKRLLATQIERPDVGKIAGATIFAPELMEALRAAPRVRRVKEGQSGLGPKLSTTKNPEDLGL